MTTLLLNAIKCDRCVHHDVQDSILYLRQASLHDVPFLMITTQCSVPSADGRWRRAYARFELSSVLIVLTYIQQPKPHEIIFGQLNT